MLSSTLNKTLIIGPFSPPITGVSFANDNLLEGLRKNKINHILEDFSLSSGGIRTVVKALNSKLNKAKIYSEITSTKAETNDILNLYEPENDFEKKWRFNSKLKLFLENKDKNNYIQHIHGVWMYPQYISLNINSKQNLKTVFTPHGMLEPWLWKQGFIKKNFYFNYLLKKKIEQVSVIHAITPSEKDNLHKLLPKAKQIEVIPNLISLKDIPTISRNDDSEKYILFLGRIDKIKGIDLLIKAFSKLKNHGFILKIAGQENKYQKELKKLVSSLNLRNKVEFIGLITGKAKFQLYKNAFVFIAPSYSEVIGMVNLEAAIMKTPVISTFQTGLLIDWNKNGGILINPNINEIGQALKNALNWSETERDERGESLYSFVEENYSWENKFKSWVELYNNT